MIYKFRMISSDERAFMRDYEIDSEALFIDLHRLIQSDLQFDSTQLASFFVTDDHWNKGLELTLLDMGAAHAKPMDAVKLSDLLKCRTDRLLYVYDIFADQYLFIELIDLHDPQPGFEYPRIAATVGEAPEQIGLDDDEEEDEDMEDFDDEDFDDEDGFGEFGEFGIDEDYM